MVHVCSIVPVQCFSHPYIPVRGGSYCTCVRGPLLSPQKQYPLLDCWTAGELLLPGKGLPTCCRRGQKINFCRCVNFPYHQNKISANSLLCLFALLALIADVQTLCKPCVPSPQVVVRTTAYYLYDRVCTRCTARKIISWCGTIILHTCVGYIPGKNPISAAHRSRFVSPRRRAKSP
jgi:hypothetical protein